MRTLNGHYIEFAYLFSKFLRSNLKEKKLKWNKNTENSSEQLQHFQTKSAQKVFGYLIYICSTINICFIWEWSFQRKKTEAAVQSCSEKKLFCKATLLKSHFSMSVPLYVCCIFSEHLLQRTPLNGCFWNNFLFSKGYFLSDDFLFLFLHFLINRNSLNKNSHHNLPLLKLEISASLKALIIPNSLKMYCAN